MEPDFFENLGVLEKHHGIDFKIIRDTYGIFVSRRWDKWRPVINMLRDDLANTTAYAQFQRLDEKIQEAEVKHARKRRRRGR
jgi:hypothetical protein